jgi:hypothetical protein
MVHLHHVICVEKHRSNYEKNRSYTNVYTFCVHIQHFDDKKGLLGTALMISIQCTLTCCLCLLLRDA